jgi:hypothetical protein
MPRGQPTAIQGRSAKISAAESESKIFNKGRCTDNAGFIAVLTASTALGGNLLANPPQVTSNGVVAQLMV